MKVLLLSSLLLLVLASSAPNLIPYPNNITYGDSELAISPCSIAYDFQSASQATLLTVPSYYFDMLDFYYQSTFGAMNCNFNLVSRHVYQTAHKEQTLNVVIVNYESGKPAYPSLSTDESYTLTLDWGNWILTASNYYGFLRGFESFVQLLEPLRDAPHYSFKYIPLTINDAPELPYRGLMIDTARHFISKETLKHVLDGMLFHKLNVFHWHLTDEESFPLQLRNIPLITQYGAYSAEEVFSRADIAEVVEYARMRGIRVIPEVDSPAHSLSWSFSAEYAEIAMKCFNWADYNGQLDPTLDKTYEVVGSILDDLHEYFPDEVVHMGGDECNFNCWTNTPSIKAFMDANGITTGVQLQQYYKDKQRSLMKPSHKAMYWVNDANFQYNEEDIFQYWSDKNSYSLIQNFTNKIVFSNYDYFYMDLGYGNVFGDSSWAPFVTWKKIYSFNTYPAGIDKSRVLGGELPLWSEVNMDGTMDNHLWSRSTAFAERFWNPSINSEMAPANIRDFAGRAYVNEKRLIKRGFKPSPLSSELCMKHLEICWPDQH